MPLRLLRSRLVVGPAAALALAALWMGWRATHDPRIAFLVPHEGAEWIVYPGIPALTARSAVDVETEFRHDFLCDSPSDSLVVSIRSFGRSLVKLNGATLRFEQADTAQWKERRDAAISRRLQPGLNRIEISIVNDRGPAAVWFLIRDPTSGETRAVTDTSWKVRRAGSDWRAAVTAAAPTHVETAAAGGTLPDLGEAFAARWSFVCGAAAILTFALLGARAVMVRLGVRAAILATARPRLATSLPFAVVSFFWVALFVNNAPSLWWSDGFDGAGHIDYIRHIATTGRLPDAHAGWSTYHPPLFYAASALLVRAAGPSIHDPGALRSIRYECLAFGLVHLLFVYLSLGLLFGQLSTRRIAGFALAAALPMHLYLFQYVTNESLAAALSSAASYAALRILRSGRPSNRACLVLGTLLGAAILTKFTPVILAVVVIYSLFVSASTTTEGIRGAFRSAGATMGACLAICGLYYAKRWAHYGSPFASAWDAAIYPPWWQDPGYQTPSYYLRFGRAVFEPYLCGLASFVDGLYSTLWGDALLGGRAAAWQAPPWDRDLVVIGCALALLPSAAIASGAVLGVVRLARRPTPQKALLAGVAAATFLAFVQMSLLVPSYAVVKAFFGTAAIIPLCAAGAVGFDVLMRRAAAARALVLLVAALWAATSFAAYWIPRGSARAETRLGRLAAHDGSGAAVARHHLATALASDSTYAPAHLGMSEALSLEARYDEAETAARKSLDLDDTNPESHLVLAMIVGRVGGDEEEAIRLVRRATELAPSDANAWLALGILLANRGLAAESLSALKTALHIDPLGRSTHRAIAQVYSHLGSMTEAETHARWAEDLGARH